MIKYDNGINQDLQDLGRIKLVKKVFEEAKKADPGAMLLINDFNTSQAYEILIEGCLEAGVPISASVSSPTSIRDTGAWRSSGRFWRDFPISACLCILQKIL